MELGRYHISTTEFVPLNRELARQRDHAEKVGLWITLIEKDVLYPNAKTRVGGYVDTGDGVLVVKLGLHIEYSKIDQWLEQNSAFESSTNPLLRDAYKNLLKSNNEALDSGRHIGIALKRELEILRALHANVSNIRELFINSN